MPLKGLTDNKKSKSYSEYEPVPSRREYRGSTFGYVAKRKLGGPISRTFEALQQTFISAPIAAAHRRLPEDWDIGDPWARIVYPGRFPRIREYAVTGTENPWWNLAYGIGADPLNVIGGIGAASKLGKAAKLVDGLGAAAEVHKVLNRGEDVYDFLKAVGRGGDYLKYVHPDKIDEIGKLGVLKGKAGIRTAIGKIIETKGAKGRPDVYKPLWERYGDPIFGDNPDQIFDAPRSLSEAMRQGKAQVFGLGWTAGWGGASELDLMSWNRLGAAKRMEQFEDVYQGARHAAFPRLFPYTRKMRALGTLKEDIARRGEALELVPERDVELPEKIGRLQTQMKKLKRQYATISTRVYKSEAGKYEKELRAAGKIRKEAVKGTEELGKIPVTEAKLKAGVPKKAEKIGDYSKSFEELTKKTDKYDTEIRDLQTQLNDARASKDANKIDSAYRKLFQTYSKYNSLQDDIERRISDLDAVSGEINDIERRISDLDKKAGQVREDIQKANAKANKVAAQAGERRLKAINKARDKFITKRDKIQANLDAATTKWNEFVRGKKGYLGELTEMTRKGAENIYHPGMQQLIQKEKDLVRIKTNRILKKKGMQTKEDITDVIESAIKTLPTKELRQTARKSAMRVFAKAIQGAPDWQNSMRNLGITQQQMPFLNDAVTRFNTLMADVAANEAEFVGFNMLENYIPWVVKRNDKGQMLPSALNDWMMGGALKAVKSLGRVERFNLRRSIGKDPWMTVTNPFHYKRNVETVKELREIGRHLTQLADDAKRSGDLAKAAELDKTKKPIVEFADFWEKAVKDYMSPHEVNEVMRPYIDKYWDEFAKSPEAKKWGIKPTDSLDEFEFYEEDFAKILPERLRGHAETMSSGETLKGFIRQFGYLKDSVAREAARLSGDPGPMDELAVLEEFAGETGQKVVNVVTYLEQRFGRTEGSIRNILGKLLGGKLEELHMDSGAADAFGDLLQAWNKVERTEGVLKRYDDLLRMWSRLTLFGGRASYIFNNFVGDRWNIALAGAHYKYVSGALALQLQLPEGMMLKGLRGIKGASDDMVMVNARNGIAYTKRDILDLAIMYDIDGGMYDSVIFEIIDKAFKGKGEPLIEDIKKLRATRIPQRIAQFSEKNGRYSLFMHFLEMGYSPADAARGVDKYLFNYSKQNTWMRRAAPFYFWTSQNVPLQFSNMFKQPAKMQVPGKVQWAFENDDDPAELATPDYLQTSGIYVGRFKGKDVYVDLRNLPLYAAQEVTGLLDSAEGVDAVIQAAAKRGMMMANPVLQFVPEIAFNRDVLTNQAIKGGGTGAVTERGRAEFLGFNVQGIPIAQYGAHAAESVFTPLNIVSSYMEMAKKPSKKMPEWFGALKYVAGAPMRQVNYKSAMYINLQRKKNFYITQADRWESLGNRHMQRKYEELAKESNDKLRKLNEDLQKERESDIRNRR